MAAGAGLARSSFFRPFRDKREILFRGMDGLAPLIGASIENAPSGQTPLEAIDTAFAHLAATSFTSGESRVPAVRDHDVHVYQIVPGSTVTRHGIADRDGQAPPPTNRKATNSSSSARTATSLCVRRAAPGLTADAGVSAVVLGTVRAGSNG